MPSKKISISIPTHTYNKITKRYEGNTSATINTQLERYFEALRRERRGLRYILTENECALILDATNGTIHYPESVPLFAYGIRDAIDLDKLDEKWDVDADVLMRKISDAPYITYLTLIDGAERWWNRVSRGETPPYTDLLAD